MAIHKANEDAAVALEKITTRESDSETELSKIKLKGEEAIKLIDLCEQAYQITTTKGLAGAFETRAKALSVSMVLWVVGLIIALFIGATTTSKNLQSLTEALHAPSTNWGLIVIEAIICVLGVGAPIWFAWVATKQIGQRFRLAEDYNYKASLAKAYEGYRREAARIDPNFESRLFSSALTRLEEPPLRLVEKETHGSPWHELVSSGVLQEATEKIPNFKKVLEDLIKKYSSSKAESKEAQKSASSEG